MKRFMSKVLIHSIKKQPIVGDSPVLGVIILHRLHSGYHIIVTIVAILCGDLFNRFSIFFCELSSFWLFLFTLTNKTVRLLCKVSSLQQNHIDKVTECYIFSFTGAAMILPKYTWLLYLHLNYSKIEMK